jgi:hypothetical protein
LKDRFRPDFMAEAPRSSAPERAAVGPAAGRIDSDKMIEATNAALSAKFGDGKFITPWWTHTPPHEV